MEAAADLAAVVARPPLLMAWAVEQAVRVL